MPKSAVASTICDCVNDKILRQGAVSLEKIEVVKMLDRKLVEIIEKENQDTYNENNIRIDCLRKFCL